MVSYSQIFYIDPLDNLEKVKTELKQAKKDKVILVLPEENKNLKNIENLTILKKESQSLGKKITIYSTDPQYKRLAEDCGIEIEESLVGGSFLDKKGEVSFRPSVSDILPRKEIKEELKEETRKEEKTLKEDEKIPSREMSEEKKELPPKKKEGSRLFPLIYLFLLFLIAGGIIFAFTWLPKADIVIVPTSEKVDFEGRFSVERGASFNLEENIVPGTVVVKEKNIEKNFSASSLQEKSEKAKGQVTVYNKDTSSYRFVIGTRFESEDGKVFRSLGMVSIPAGNPDNPSTVDVEVIATEAGAEYNIGPSSFTLPGLKGTPLYDKISAKSTKAMSGGFVGTTKTISKDDLVSAQEEMQKLQDSTEKELKEDILKDLPSSFQFLKDVIVVEKGEISFDKKEGDIGDTFKGASKVKASVLTFKEESVQKIISKIVKEKIKEGIEFQEVLATQKIKYKLLKKEKSLETLNINFEGDENVAWKIDENEIKKAVIGKNPEEFKKYITDETGGKIKDAQLSLWPFYVNKIPTRENRIKIIVQYK